MNLRYGVIFLLCFSFVGVGFSTSISACNTGLGSGTYELTTDLVIGGHCFF